jgi:hypothetical protein
MVKSRFGIGMSAKEAEDFWRELVLILIGVPFLIIIGVMIIDTLLNTALGTNLGFFKYILYGIGGVGWIIVLYRKYIKKIISSI